MPKITLPQQRKSFKNNHLHTLIFCASFGAIFGIVAISFMFFTGNPIQLDLLSMLIVFISSTMVSALAGLFSIILDKLFLKIGMSGEGRRGVFIYLTMVILILTLGSWLIPKKYPMIQNHFLSGGILGCGLGGLAAIVYNQYWKYKIKVQALELENKYLAELAEKDRQLKVQTEKIVIVEERNRIARDLHDSVSQGIHSLVFLIHTLRKNYPEPEPKFGEIINQLEKTVNATLEELRAMILELKPSLLETHGLVEAIKLQTASFSKRLNIPVNLHINDFLRLFPNQETALYRILQEALINIQKHAQATLVTITLKETEQNQIQLIIEDNGIGFSTNNIKQGNGLQNIGARCQENNGKFEISSTPGKGTRLEIVLALPN